MWNFAKFEALKVFILPQQEDLTQLAGGENGEACDEAASSIVVVDEATMAINTNAVQQLTVSDHPRARRNSAGDDGIHYYENHDSLLLEQRLVTYH